MDTTEPDGAPFANSNWKVDKKGRSIPGVPARSRDKKQLSECAIDPPSRKKGHTPGKWAWIECEVMNSPAFAVLSPVATKALFVLVNRHAGLARRKNGHLSMGYAAFENFGLSDRVLTQALKEAEALGFLQRTFGGRRPYGPDRGRAQEFRLTFFGTFDAGGKPVKPTNEWKTIKSLAQAKEIVASIRKRRSMNVGEQKDVA